jgi:predicted transcriptional regulator
MVTTIQVSAELQQALTKKKMYTKETYEEVIWDLLEDTMELSEETKRDIEKSLDDIKHGRTISLEELKKKYKS